MINLFHGDCLEKLKDISDKSIDFILTDPPYGTTACKWDVVIPFDLMWKELNRVIKDNGAIALFGSEPFSSFLRCSNLKKYKYDWKWDKTTGGNPLNYKNRPASVVEDICIFNASSYFPIMEEADLSKNRPKVIVKQNSDLLGKINSFKEDPNRDRSKRFPKNILTFSNREGECNPINRMHPTQKPVPLLEYLIKTYTLENETVLDFTMGSGSTGVACKNLNRSFIGIEKDEKYFEIAKNRIESHIVDTTKKS